MAEASMVTPMLQEMREEMRARFDDIDQRLMRLERGQTGLRHALSGEMVANRTTYGELEDRLMSLEKRVAAVEGRR
jgi:polyhydroxyalkanoate synthesis regulator phasin